jgi:SAM-dependent methyltransferase
LSGNNKHIEEIGFILFNYFQILSKYNDPSQGWSDMTHREVISEEIISTLYRQGISLEGKSVLDVGARTGENAHAMIQHGANVIVCDPDENSLQQGIEAGYLKPEDVRFGTLQDFSSEFYGKFDLVTCFMWCIPFAQRETFTAALCNALKPGGKIILGLVDDAFINDPHGAAVKPLMDRYCQNVQEVQNSEGYNKCFLVCTSPRDIPLKTRAAHTRNSESLVIKFQ